MVKLRKLREDRRGLGWILYAVIAVLVIAVVVVAGLYLNFVSEKPPVDVAKVYGHIDYSLRLNCYKQVGGSNSFDFMTPPDTLRFIKTGYQPQTQDILSWMNDGVKNLGWFDSSMTIEVKTRVQCVPAGYDFLLTSQQSVSWGMEGMSVLTWVPDVLIWVDTPGIYSITWEAYDKTYGNMLAQDTASIVVPAP